MEFGGEKIPGQHGDMHGSDRAGESQNDHGLPQVLEQIPRMMTRRKPQRGVIRVHKGIRILIRELARIGNGLHRLPGPPREFNHRIQCRNPQLRIINPKLTSGYREKHGRITTRRHLIVPFIKSDQSRAGSAASGEDLSLCRRIPLR